MSDRKRLMLDSAVIAALLAACVAFAKAYFVTPIQIEELRESHFEMRRDVDRIRESRAIDHDLLQRIDERTAQIQKTLTEQQPSRR